jgi:hypothetical protein
MTWKSYVLASGAMGLATYMFSTPPAVAPRPAAPAPQRSAMPAPSVDIQAEAARLQTRVREKTEFQEPSRNPFRYVAPARAARPVREAEVLPEVEMPLPIPEPPRITLAGIATKTGSEGARQRTAVLVTTAGPLEVREGDAVGAEYRVVRIEDDAVELAAADGARRRIVLRP